MTLLRVWKRRKGGEEARPLDTENTRNMRHSGSLIPVDSPRELKRP